MLLAVGFVGSPVVLSTSTGCSTQETSPAPDAALPPCKTGPFIFCQPVGADTPSCNTDDGTSHWLARLGRATRYPVGCVIDYVGERDEQGDCKLEGVCKCVAGDIPATGDAGSSDAGATGPVWNCSP